MNEILAAPPAPGAMTAIESSRAVQEVQAALVIAKRFPRNEVAAVDRIINACTRIGLAEVAVYQYARGGQDVSGPSIRLAEAIAKLWGNLDFGVVEIESTEGKSTMEAYCWDLETNVKTKRVFQVAHVRYKKSYGNGPNLKPLEDPRDIYEGNANAGARRLRACILASIPGDVIEAALAQCETTMKAKADTSPDAQARIVTAFAKYGVTKEQVETRIQRRLDAITPAQVVNLRRILASLKDGMSSPEEWFPKPPSAAGEPPDPFAPPAGAVTTPEAAPEPTPAPPAPESPTHTDLRGRISAADFPAGNVLGTIRGLGITSAPSIALMTPAACQQAIDQWAEIEAEMKEGGW